MIAAHASPGQSCVARELRARLHEVTLSQAAPQKCARLTSHWRLLVASELMVAAEAAERAGVVTALGEITASAHSQIRSSVNPLGADRPLGPDLERLAIELLLASRLAV